MHAGGEARLVGTANALIHDMALATCIATRAEKHRPLPGDVIVPDPMFTVTHAITIDAPIERVWPWLAQMGSDRAGWYSWDAIDNGAEPSAVGIVPQLQAVARGDVMPAVPGAKDAFVVAAVDPPHDLVLTVPDGKGGEEFPGSTFSNPSIKAERGSSCEGVSHRIGLIAPVQARLPVSAAS